MPTLAKLKAFMRVCSDAAVWRAPNRRVMVRAVTGRRVNAAARYQDDDYLHAAAGWLARAQDASTDGGVAGRYHLRQGWTSSYPETTGYIIPTFLRLADAHAPGNWDDRAARAVQFLLGVQLAAGGFPGGEIAENRTEPSVFNTGQIICGLTAWHRRTGDERALAAALRAGAWMAAAQESDGSWRRWIYGNTPYTYIAYAACWLGRLGEMANEPRLLESATRHLDWVLRERDPETGWFRRCGFSGLGAAADDLAHTHTIAYTIAGVLELSQLARHEEGLVAAREAALRVARTLELKQWLPGLLDRHWKGRATFACLTGNAQMALIWLELHAMRYDPALVNAALKALDLVQLAQPLVSTDPGIRGGIAGSDPPWGGYLYLAYPNWAAKYFVDALLAKRDALAALSIPKAPGTPPQLRTELPAAPSPPRPDPPRIVLLTGSDAVRAVRVADAARRHGARLAAVISEVRPDPPLWRRAWDIVRENGIPLLARRVWMRVAPRGRAVSAAPRAAPTTPTIEAYCRAHEIPHFHCERLDSPLGRTLLRHVAPDLGIHAGAGILRHDTISAHRLGVLNAHMGLLPWFRGMNVAEWSVLYGFPVGCTAHLINAGIDTGDILCHRVVPIAGARNITDLRQTVDDAQLDLLADVVAFVAAAGTLPPGIPQHAHDGRQFFRLHPALRSVLERHLAQRASARTSRE